MLPIKARRTRKYCFIGAIGLFVGTLALETPAAQASTTYCGHHTDGWFTQHKFQSHYQAGGLMHSIEGYTVIGSGGQTANLHYDNVPCAS